MFASGLARGVAEAPRKEARCPRRAHQRSLVSSVPHRAAAKSAWREKRNIRTAPGCCPAPRSTLHVGGNAIAAAGIPERTRALLPWAAPLPGRSFDVPLANGASGRAVRASRRNGRCGGECAGSPQPYPPLSVSLSLPRSLRVDAYSDISARLQLPCKAQTGTNEAPVRARAHTPEAFTTRTRGAVSIALAAEWCVTKHRRKPSAWRAGPGRSA